MHSRILITTIAAGAALIGCSVKSPPTGGNILTDYGRSQVPGTYSAPHRNGRVAPGWIYSFGDPQLTRLVEDAIVRNPDLKAAAERVEASRAAVRIAASSLYPRAGLKGLGERQGSHLSGDLGLGI